MSSIAYSKLPNETTEQTPEDKCGVEKKWSIIKESLNTLLRAALQSKRAKKRIS